MDAASPRETGRDRAGAAARVLSPEGRRLLATVRSVTGGDAAEAGGAGVADPPPGTEGRAADAVDGRKLLELAVRERAVPVLWDDLTSRERASLSPDVAASFPARAAVAEFRMRRTMAALEEAVEDLASAGIEVVLLKGAALLRDPEGYGGVRQRPMLDLDVLVEEDRAQEGRDVLLASGWRWREEAFRAKDYRGHHHLPPLEHRDGPGVVLELHTDLFPQGHPFSLGADHVRRGARLVSVGGRRAGIPDPVVHLAYICLHCAWSHVLQRAGWRTFRDAAVLLRSRHFDRRRFVELARRCGGEGGCYWTLALARELAGVPVPDAILEALRPNLPVAIREGLLRHFALQLFGDGPECPSLQVHRWLWTVAMRPGAGGHGDARPWALAGGTPPPDREPPMGLWDRLVWHGSRADEWVRYLFRLGGLPALRAGRSS